MWSALSGTHCNNNIGLFWTDEELIMLLAKITKDYLLLPDNVIENVNPYQYKPSNLPEDVWFYVRSDLKKNSENGFWKAKEEPSEIFGNSSVTGLRNTLEYYEGQDPHAQRTNWVMQEYSLYNNNNIKGSNLLCRVFLTSGKNENKNLQQKLDFKEYVGPETGSTQARSRGDKTEPLITSEGVQNLFENDCFARGDYLELDDLLDQGSRSFSSDDTSCVTISSDECFDSLALLKDLEDEINKSEKGKSVNFQYSVAASPKPDEVVIPAVTLESLNGSCNVTQSPDDNKRRDKKVVKNASETLNVKNGDKKRSKSNSEDGESSSSTNKLFPQGEKKEKNSARKLKKLKRKYLCFMPF